MGGEEVEIRARDSKTTLDPLQKTESTDLIRPVFGEFSILFGKLRFNQARVLRSSGAKSIDLL